MSELTLPADVPLALLPVRLETRFTEGHVLRIRVYPDQIHIDTHEPELTAAETQAGQEYWNAVWRAAEEQTELTAWDGLANRYGSERGAWIARELRPTNPGGRAGEAPQFPTPPSREQAWTRAPLARGLPTRWHAVGIPLDHQGLRARATGHPITTPLAVGPSPRFNPSSLPDDAPPVDPETRWLVNFKDAVDVGMGLTLDPPELPAGSEPFGGYARLFVYGVLENADGAEGARILAALLDAHYYTHGFAYLAQGTPTNNTPGAAAAPSRRDPAYRAAYRPRLTPAAAPAADANAAVLARALGMPVSGSLVHAAGAAEREQPQARWMHTALWQPTWGYFLSQMLGADVTDAQVHQVRQHVLDWVRPAGPLPTLRVGSQPYGVLPVLATPAYLEREGAEFGDEGLGAGTVAFLQRLRQQLWEPSVTSGSVPRAADRRGPETAVRILGMGAHAQAYYARSLLGMEYLAYLWRFSEPLIPLDASWRTDLTDAAAALGRRLGLGDWDPRVGRAVFATESFPIPGAAVQAPGGTPPKTYLAELAAKDLTAAAAGVRVDTGSPELTPLLYRLLRHALLLEHAQAAARVWARAGLAPVPREPELIDIVPGPATDPIPPTQTIWWQLAQQGLWTPSGSSQRLGAYLIDAANNDSAMADLVEFRVALSALAELPAATLERLMAQSIDLASHRLDAWLTSFAAKRLEWLRRPAPPTGQPRAVGVQLGGYAWLEDLQPRPDRQTVGPLDKEPEPLWRDPHGAGYVHAPSLAHATTAAVLRGGHSAYAVNGTGPFAIDLRSHRVQLATWLLDGVRQGQPLGALLGYRVERALQEHPRTGLPAYLPTLRSHFPRRVTGVSAEGGTSDPVRTFDVVDGLALQRAWSANPLALLDRLQVTDPGDRTAFTDVLTGLTETVDAVADALLAEGVHHVVQGNPLRAGAALDAADRGEAPPPELEVTRTPRTGVTLTHRLLIVLDQDTPAPADWPVDPEVQARAAAEPRLNAWLATLIPAPGRVRYRAEAVGTADGQIRRVELDLTALRMSPLDLVALPEREPDAALSELDLRLIAAVRAMPGVGPAAQVRLDLTRDPDWDRQIVIDPRYSGFAEATGRTVTISGYRVTVDGRALSHDLLPLSMLGGSTILARDTTHELTYIPAAGYGFHPASGMVADFRYNLTVDGQVVVDSRYAGFAEATGHTLTIRGYRVTIDGRALPHDLVPLSLLGNARVLSRDTTHDLTLIPAAGYVLRAHGGPGPLSYRFSLDADGKINLSDGSGELIITRPAIRGE